MCSSSCVTECVQPKAAVAAWAWSVTEFYNLNLLDAENAIAWQHAELELRGAHASDGGSMRSCMSRCGACLRGGCGGSEFCWEGQRPSGCHLRPVWPFAVVTVLLAAELVKGWDWLGHHASPCRRLG